MMTDSLVATIVAVELIANIDSPSEIEIIGGVMTDRREISTTLVEETIPSEVAKIELDHVAPIESKEEMNVVGHNEIIEKMNKKYAWLTSPMQIYRIEDGSVVTKDALRSNYMNTSVTVPVDGTYKPMSYIDAWLRSSNRREHVDFAFMPGGGEIINNHINLWKGWGSVPESGDITPWEQMMDYVFGVGTPERKWATQWFAYPLQHPGTKLNTAMVIWSSYQGVGKSLLAETVGMIYGEHFKTISAMELHSQYNGWTECSLLVLGEENSSSDRRADSNKLKQLITGATIFKNEKFQSARVIANQMNFIFTSNHPDAFHLEIHDRRYFVWSIDSTPKDASFYDTFAKWRNSKSGLAALMHHLMNVDLVGFDPCGDALVTNAKLEMTEHSKTDLERWLPEAMSDEYIDGSIKREIVTLDEMVGMYQRDTGAVRTNTTAMGKAMRRMCKYSQCRISTPCGRPKVVSLRRHEFWAVQDNLAWAAEYAKPSPTRL